MNTLELIPEFIEAGVVSLKLEGRMKKPEYVAVVVDAYRQKSTLTIAIQKFKKIFKKSFSNIQS